jgi:uncharacterized protein
MTRCITAITRYPVKGLSGEALPEVKLVTGHGIDNDRRYALALADTDFDVEHPQPLPKTKFVCLMRFARLAALSSRYDDATSELMLSSAEGPIAAGRLDEAAGRAKIEAAVEGFMARDLSGRPRIVEAAGHRFTDVSVVSPEMMEAVSIINLASVRALEAKLGQKVDPRRFRANFLIDGLAPWVEFDWIDREVTINDVSLKGSLCTRRCAATEVNPDTAERDIKLPTELMRNFGHMDMGIYLYVQSPGTIALGDRIES